MGNPQVVPGRFAERVLLKEPIEPLHGFLALVHGVVANGNVVQDIFVCRLFFQNLLEVFDGLFVPTQTLVEVAQLNPNSNWVFGRFNGSFQGTNGLFRASLFRKKEPPGCMHVGVVGVQRLGMRQEFFGLFQPFGSNRVLGAFDHKRRRIRMLVGAVFNGLQGLAKIARFEVVRGNLIEFIDVKKAHCVFKQHVLKAFNKGLFFRVVHGSKSTSNLDQRSGISAKRFPQPCEQPDSNP